MEQNRRRLRRTRRWLVRFGRKREKGNLPDHGHDLHMCITLRITPRQSLSHKSCWTALVLHSETQSWDAAVQKAHGRTEWNWVATLSSTMPSPANWGLELRE